MAEYAQERLDSEGDSQNESPCEPDLDLDMTMIGTSPRVLELVRSSNRNTPSMSSDDSIDTIETFGELNLDDVYDDLVSNSLIFQLFVIGLLRLKHHF